VLVPDLLGYGGSTPWPTGEPFHLDRDLEMLQLLLDEVREPVHLVGHSYGGFLALKLAVARAAAVRSLALFEPVAFGVLGEHDADARRVLDAISSHYDLAAPDGVDEAWIAQFVDWWNGAGAYASLASEAREAFRKAGWKIFQEVASLGADTTPADAYRPLTIPTLLLGGSRSPLPAGRVLSRLEEAMPNARRHVFEGLGHMAPVSSADVVNRAIAAHLDSADPVG
jgi:pimeloyl-ACP methyl ester carboxylesterase